MNNNEETTPNKDQEQKIDNVDNNLVDDNPENNHYSNLKWGTQKQNMNDMRKNLKLVSFKQKYDDSLLWEVYNKREKGFTIKELREQYPDVTPSTMMHMTSGRMLKLRGLI